MSGTDDDNIQHASNDDALHVALRQLRRDSAPTRDLWQQIERKVSAMPPSSQMRRIANARLVPWALAASLLLALGVTWQLQRPQPRTGEARLINREARAMTRDYQGALKMIATSAPDHAHTDPALQELDRSAALIRHAIDKDPDARYLLDRLRHTYAMRLALTQRAALS